MKPSPPIKVCGLLVGFAALLMSVDAHASTVTLTTSDTAGQSSFNAASHWSNGAAPSAANDYVDATYALRTPATAGNFNFSGASLTIGNGSGAGTLHYKGTASNFITVSNLIVNNGIVDNLSDSVTTMYLAGSITLLGGNNNFAVYSNSNAINVSANITGAGGLQINNYGTTAATTYGVTLAGTNSYSGGTIVNNKALLIAGGDSSLGSGNVRVNVGGKLKLRLGAINDYIGDSAQLFLASGLAVGAVILNYSGTDTIGGLSFDGGTTLASAGTWGAPGSGAAFTNGIFTGAGFLCVKYVFMSLSGLIPYQAPPPYMAITNYYVNAVTGNDNNNGTSPATAWQTLIHAITVFSGSGSHYGGVCVNVAPGYYYGNVNSNTPNGSIINGTTNTAGGYLVFRSTTPEAAVIVQSAGQYTAVKLVYSHYVIFDGFEITGDAGTNKAGSGVEYYSSDHIQILNCDVHDVGGFGIGGELSDYITIQGNIVWDTSGYAGPADTSGIINFHPVAVDSASGFHNIISDNISFHNCVLNSGDPSHSEGHGIMMDLYNSPTLTGHLPYTGKTLVENNLCFNNGGIGIHIFLSGYVTVRNNTVFKNGQDTLITTYNLGEISVFNGSSNAIINNITFADPNARAPWINYSLDENYDSRLGSPNVGNVWANNLTFNGTPGDPSTGGSNGANITGNGNIFGSDPTITNPLAGDFSPLTGSPAIGHGTTTYGGIPALDALDLGGNPQTLPPVIGAYVP